MTEAGGTCWLGDGIGQIDLRFQGQSAVIAVYVIDTTTGFALVDCGPGSTVPALLEGLDALGLDPERLRQIVLTHIHLDHAGAGGELLQRFPAATLYVHEVGAPHMIDPSRLLSSAQRIYGADMDTLWGSITPAPPERLVVVSDCDELNVGDRRLRVLYTPGHAQHHIALHEPDTGTVFAGDVAGVRIPPAVDVFPPTPPPDIDPPAWHASVARVRASHPTRLLLAHFGEAPQIDAHLNQLEVRLDEWLALVRQWSAQGLDRDAMVARLSAHASAGLDSGADSDEDTRTRFSMATPYGMAVDGLRRYLRTHNDGGST